VLVDVLVDVEVEVDDSVVDWTVVVFKDDAEERVLAAVEFEPFAFPAIVAGSEEYLLPPKAVIEEFNSNDELPKVALVVEELF
jgi:hypothetical protein